ncbi:uncharacterized protein H6S33_000228 [Morchella sextelata]|uniref:uncharacterized protein n=1 Tax=Morchella sextelata TaxID=1174677 RepID=UPI001D0430BA|nr:uncharacterized protein H6S33_000228 [Morchella sextelata]KAH0614592.1 hypothetical protein H6S33_000228 [Morchella sextelata]
MYTLKHSRAIASLKSEVILDKMCPGPRKSSWVYGYECSPPPRVFGWWSILQGYFLIKLRAPIRLLKILHVVHRTLLYTIKPEIDTAIVDLS